MTIYARLFTGRTTNDDTKEVMPNAGPISSEPKRDVTGDQPSGERADDADNCLECDCGVDPKHDCFAPPWGHAEDCPYRTQEPRTIRVMERWTKDGNWIERKIGDGPWERIPNLRGQVPFVKFQGEANMAVTTDYSKHSNQRITALDLENFFIYHAPKGDQAERYSNLREIAKELAILTVKYCPPCADTTAALRKLREFVMAANNAIACNE